MPIIIGALVVLAILLFLNHRKIISWQFLTMLTAVLAAPIKFLSSWLKGSGERMAEIKTSHETARAQEASFREPKEAELQKNKEIIDAQNKKIEELNSKINTVEEKRNSVKEQVENMSEREKIQLANELFGK